MIFQIEVDDSAEHIHVRIFMPLPHTQAPAEYVGHQPGKTVDEDIAYFWVNKKIFFIF